MRTIITGSRDIEDVRYVEEAVTQCPWLITTLLSGNAAGVERLAEQWAKGRLVPIEHHIPKWWVDGKMDRGANIRRNMEISGVAEALLVVWDGKSANTKHMIKEARKTNLKVHILDTRFMLI
jgi:hypothetical protein